MRLPISLASTLLLAVLLEQCRAATPTFEVASIKPAPPLAMGQIRVRLSTDGGMLRYSNVSLKDVVRIAYRVKDFQVQGPDWIGSVRYDINAKFPDGATQEQVPEMLQALLADRFKLKLHRDTKEHNVLALVAGKNGPKLKAANPENTSPPPGAGPNSSPIPGGPPRGAVMMRMDPNGMHLTAAAVTLSALAEMISRSTERPVIDMTGIQGQYEFDLVFAPETMRNMPGPGPMMGPGGGEPHSDEGARERAGSIYDAVQVYGLKLEARKSPMEVLTIDHVEKEPTEN